MIESINSENRREFWKHIKSLGPKKKSNKIPCEVYCYDEKGKQYLSNDQNTVLDTWKYEFENLCNLDGEQNIDGEFEKTIEENISVSENCMSYGSQTGMNKPIEIGEVQWPVNRSKSGKSMGPDNLPYEIFKNENSVNLLTKLYNYIFETGVIPSLWRTAIIKPIPKNSTKDFRVPAQYRAISLLSAVYKLFTTILNKRISDFLDQNCKLCDAQNGFRPSRNGEDHIFTLLNILKNRKAKSQPTFVAFINAEKAFDKVNRSCLFFKLIQTGVTGNFIES